MNGVETIVRRKNIDFFLAMSEERTVRDAARRSGLSYQHAKKVLRRWRQCGWVVRQPTLHGMRYAYTVEGAAIASAAREFSMVL